MSYIGNQFTCTREMCGLWTMEDGQCARHQTERATSGIRHSVAMHTLCPLVALVPISSGIFVYANYI